MLDRLRPFAVIVFFFLALFIYTKLSGPLPFSVNSVNTQKSDTFNVSGEGKTTIRPDLAVINAGITANATTVKGAQDQINQVINNISKAVKALGVDEKDIQTSNYNVRPNYDYTSGTQRITGYYADTNLSIKIRDINKVNDVIDAATKNGANQVGGVSFDVADKTKAQDEARAKAVEDAKRKAQDAAKAAGFTLGKIINYSESFPGESRPVPMALKVADGAGAASSTNVETGSSEIIINVTLSYEIR